MQNSKIRDILNINDRKGERGIAIAQGVMAFTIFVLHIISSYKNQWEILSSLTIGISGLILTTSLIRAHASYAATLNNFHSHALTVLDGLLIYALMLSYNHAYNLPLEATFKTPTVVFLIVYSAARILRSDPWAILVAGATTLTGWIGIFIAAMLNEPKLTTSYAEFVSSDKLLVGAVFELALGYAAVILVLALYTRNARKFVAKTAHVKDLAIANLKAEENILIFEELLNSSVDGVVIVDKEGNIERLNPAIERLFGYKAEELLGKNVSHLMSESNATLLRGAVQAYIKTKQSHLIGHIFASTGIKKDGTQFDIELSISEFTASGKSCFAGFIRDTSEKTLALANEQRIARQFENAMNAAMDAIIIIDQDDKIIQFNPSAEEIFGHGFGEVVGKKLSEVIIPHRYREAHDKGMAHYMKTGEGPVLNNRIEIEGLHADGHELQIELAIREIEGANGKLFLGYARDISERKNFEAQLLDAMNAAEVASRAKTSFLAMMSHEIRTPMNGVLGIHGLLKETDLDEDQRQLLATASDSGNTLLAIINDLLDFSKLEAGKLEIEEKPFDLRHLAMAIIGLVQPHADEKRLKLSYETDESISDTLLGDATRIRQVLLNLLWNAIKFTEQGYVSLKLHKGENNEIVFSVKDTGIGIAEENHGALFVEFSTIDASYSEKFGGTGLGLAICKSLVENMNGKIGFESSPGRGSHFWFKLNLQPTHKPIENCAATNLEIDNLDIIKGKRILVVEDNRTNQLVTSRYLKKFNCLTELANNGIEAVELTHDIDFDLILMDISMPEMDGFEATAAIREHKLCDCPIIALTAYASKEDREHILNAGMDGFIAKPFTKTQLAKVLLDHLAVKSTNNISAEEVRDSNDTGFDFSTMDTVLEDMDEDALMEIFKEFNHDVQRYLQAANEGLTTKDAALLESASHGLQGVSSMFGARALSDLAFEVNQTCKSENQEKLYEEAVALIKAAHEIIEKSDQVKMHYIRKAQNSN